MRSARRQQQETVATVAGHSGGLKLNVVIAPDKFKGTLSAREAAQGIARGWRQARRDDRLHLLPVTDGGDGFGAVLSAVVGAREQKTVTVDAAHRRCVASWWWESKTKTAIVESAKVIGLAMLPKGQFHPFELDTFGLGKVIQAAARKGARKCFIGIGGSATNDGGFGLARAFGWRFFGSNNAPIKNWTQLSQTTGVQPPRKRRWPAELIVAVDVQNPLLGRQGATRIYGPQKGLRPLEFRKAERALAALAHLAPKIAKTAGAGAAGGLGFGLAAFLAARLQNGFEIFARLARLEKHVRNADLVITGEGRIDRSTFMGKAVGQVARRCKQFEIPCVALAGGIVNKKQVKRSFKSARALEDLVSREQAMAQGAHWLEVLAARLAAGIQRSAQRPTHGRRSCAPKSALL